MLNFLKFCVLFFFLFNIIHKISACFSNKTPVTQPPSTSTTNTTSITTSITTAPSTTSITTAPSTTSTTNTTSITTSIITAPSTISSNIENAFRTAKIFTTELNKINEFGSKASSISKPSINWQPGDWAHACDFSNNDLSNVQTTGADCGPTCVNNPKCTHFTWTNNNGGTCWLKTGDISKNDAFYTGDNTMVCGVVQKSPIIIPPSIDWQLGDWAFACDFPNHDLINVQTIGADCGPTCSNNPQCTHFTWKTYNNGTCCLKYGKISKNDAIKTNDTSMVCGIISLKLLTLP